MSDILFETKFMVPKHLSKKNQKRVGFRYTKNGMKPFIRSESKSAFTEAWLVQKFVGEKLKQRVDTINEDVNVQMIFYYPKTVFYAKAGHRSNKVIDLSNAYQSYEDALTKAGVIIDDKIICAHDGSRRLPHDLAEYYIHIVVTSLAQSLAG